MEDKVIRVLIKIFEKSMYLLSTLLKRPRTLRSRTSEQNCAKAKTLPTLVSQITVFVRFRKIDNQHNRNQQNSNGGNHHYKSCYYSCGAIT